MYTSIPFLRNESIMTDVTTEETQTTLRSGSGHDITPLSAERIAELAEKLTDEERRVLLPRRHRGPLLRWAARQQGDRRL